MEQFASWSLVIKLTAYLQTKLGSHLFLASFPLFLNCYTICKVSEVLWHYFFSLNLMQWLGSVYWNVHQSNWSERGIHAHHSSYSLPHNSLLSCHNQITLTTNSQTFPWLWAFSLTSPWPWPNSLAFPGFPKFQKSDDLAFYLRAGRGRHRTWDTTEWKQRPMLKAAASKHPDFSTSAG